MIKCVLTEMGNIFRYWHRLQFSAWYYFCHAIYWMFVETFQMVLVRLFHHVLLFHYMPWQTYHHILTSHHLYWIYLQLTRTHSWLSCYMLPLFLVAVDKILEWLIFYVVILKKALKDFGCKLFTIVMHDFLGLSLTIIHSSSTSRTSTLLFLSEHLLATFLEQSSIQLMI